LKTFFSVVYTTQNVLKDATNNPSKWIDHDALPCILILSLSLRFTPA
jgi:hypothetical protein